MVKDRCFILLWNAKAEAEVKPTRKPGRKPGPARAKGVSIVKESKAAKPEAFRDPVSMRYYRFIVYLVAKGKVKNVTQFGKRVDTSGAVFTAMKAGTMSITTERNERTAREFPELNMNWLFTGNGDMINGTGSAVPTPIHTEASGQTNLTGSILGKLKECRLLLNGSWEGAAKDTGLQQEDLDQLEAGQKPFIPYELMRYLHEGEVDINSLFDNSKQGVSMCQQGHGNYEEILKQLKIAENSILDMQQSNSRSLDELQQLTGLLRGQPQVL